MSRNIDSRHHGMPSVTNRHADGRVSGATTFGPPGQGGGQDRADSDARGHAGRGPKGYVRSDARIVDDVQLTLREAHDVDASQVLLIVENGVVTLTGNVPDRAMKRAAEQCVADVRGVSDVINRIRVDDGSASAGQPGEAVRSGNDQQGSGFSSSMREQGDWRVR